MKTREKITMNIGYYLGYGIAYILPRRTSKRIYENLQRKNAERMANLPQVERKAEHAKLNAFLKTKR